MSKYRNTVFFSGTVQRLKSPFPTIFCGKSRNFQPTGKYYLSLSSGSMDAQIGDDSLYCRRELSDGYDEYAGAIIAIDLFKREEVLGHVPLFLSLTLSKFLRLPESYASWKVTGRIINREVDAEFEIPIEINFIGKETAIEWLKKALPLHPINIMIEKEILKCKK